MEPNHHESPVEAPFFEPQIDSTHLSLFKEMLLAIVAKEGREGTSGHFKDVQMNYEELTADDAVIFYRYMKYPGYESITRADFLKYKDRVNVSNSQTRKAFSMYLANVLTGVFGQQELDELERREGKK